MVGGMVMVGSLVANNSPVKLTDVTPIARLTGESEVIVVPAGSPFKSMKDLVEVFKADPGKVSWAGGSAGGTDHILAGMIAKAAGVDPKSVTYVAYRRRRSGPGRTARQPGHLRHLRLRRVRRADQGRQAARARDLLACQARRHRCADAEGAGHRRRAGQLARRVRRAGHHADQQKALIG